MQRLSLVSLTLVERRKMLVWTMVATVLLLSYALAVFPSFRDNEDITALIDSLPETMKSFFSITGDVYATGAGYLNTEVLTFMVPIVLMIVGIGAASSTLAGEEDSGRMDLLLSGPVTRSRMFVERGIGVALALILVCGVILVMILAGNVVVDLEIPAGHALGAVAMSWLYSMHYAALAMAIAGATGAAGAARGVTSTLAVASYLVQSLAGIEPSLEKIARFAAYHHYMENTPLISGIDWGDASILAATTAAWLAIGLAGFCRRDIG
jgi:ABC-2 type transport system permease protein